MYELHNITFNNQSYNLLLHKLKNTQFFNTVIVHQDINSKYYIAGVQIASYVTHTGLKSLRSFNII